jgi:putative transposase
MSDQPKYDPEIHHRRSLRLKEFDYSQVGAYFITICTQNREQLFGEIDDTQARMVLNEFGIIVRDVWDQTQKHYPDITLDTYVIMPNHFHGIIIVGAGSSRPLSQGPSKQKGREDPAPTVGNILGYFKYQSTKQINAARNAGFQKLWQRNYYDHVIRDDDDLNRIHEYIENNPANWLQDELFVIH